MSCLKVVLSQFVALSRLDGVFSMGVPLINTYVPRSVVVPYCYLFLLSVFILWFSYYVSDIFCKF